MEAIKATAMIVVEIVDNFLKEKEALFRIMITDTTRYLENTNKVVTIETTK